uniref:Uncharacterized protein n=2 Tax=Pandoraea faecigallinarum TaxID=656179 RepID=A0A0H3WMR2_9BURK
MQTLQDRLQTCAPGSAELTRAIERVEAAFTRSDGWRFIKRCFERDVDRDAFVRRLLLSHLSTTPTGLEHVRHAVSEARLDAYATQLTRTLRPHIRAEIVNRWSQPDDTGLHVTQGKFIAVGVPGTDLRLSLMDGGFSFGGLNLTQTEATQLLLAHPEGTPPGTTLLDVMPDLTEDHPVANFRIVGAAIGADGSLLPGLDRDAVHAVAAAAHDALARVSGVLAEREPLARFFEWMGDDRRTAQSRQIIATIHSAMSAPENGGADEIAREGPATLDDVRRFNDVRAGENRQRAAFHYARAAQPRQAAAQYLESARIFAAAGDRAMAAGNYANAAERLATCDPFSAMADVLADAINVYGNDFRAVSMIGSRCADVFAGRGLHISAAMVHELVFVRLGMLRRGAGADARAIAALEASHMAKAQAHFADVGLAASDMNVASLIRSAIDARLDRFDAQEGLRGDGYTILFEEHSDMISAEEFDRNAPTEWVLLRRGEATARHQIFELVTSATRARLMASGSRHPYLQQPLRASDFIEGTDALDMLTATVHKASPERFVHAREIA